MNNLPNFYLKGTFNGWGLDTPFTQLSAEQYSACVVFSADQHRFKITDMDGSEQWTFSGHEIDPTTVELNQTTPLLTTHGIGNDLLFTPSATGRFTLLLDLSDGAPSLTIQTGGDNQQTLSKRDRLCARLNSVSAPASSVQRAPLNPPLFSMRLRLKTMTVFRSSSATTSMATTKGELTNLSL
ncbi:hypothetical protein RJ46_04565, partial [Vibrio sinaloensis]